MLRTDYLIATIRKEINVETFPKLPYRFNIYLFQYTFISTYRTILLR